MNQSEHEAWKLIKAIAIALFLMIMVAFTIKALFNHDQVKHSPITGTNSAFGVGVNEGK